VPLIYGTVANGINASGRIVGGYYDAAASGHGFLYDQGSYATLDPPGSTFTQVTGISDASQIVGYYLDASGGQHDFLATPVP
jgi:probable HAF family extracellular repeat protein